MRTGSVCWYEGLIIAQINRVGIGLLVVLAILGLFYFSVSGAPTGQAGLLEPSSSLLATNQQLAAILGAEQLLLASHQQRSLYLPLRRR